MRKPGSKLRAPTFLRWVHPSGRGRGLFCSTWLRHAGPLGCLCSTWYMGPYTKKAACGPPSSCLWEASGPVSRVLSRTAIYLEYASPRISSAQPERTEGQPYSVPICVCSGWGLPSRIVADALVRSYRTVSAFLPQRGGVFFSVALSVGSPRPAVSWHLALRSPDFPRTPEGVRDRLARSPVVL